VFVLVLLGFDVRRVVLLTTGGGGDDIGGRVGGADV
jgi:hypothetical protein